MLRRLDAWLLLRCCRVPRACQLPLHGFPLLSKQWHRHSHTVQTVQIVLLLLLLLY
jgi:hypothetical protein